MDHFAAPAYFELLDISCDALLPQRNIFECIKEVSITVTNSSFHPNIMPDRARIIYRTQYIRQQCSVDIATI